MLFRSLISFTLFFSFLPVFCGNPRVKMADAVACYREKAEKLIELLPDLYLNQEKRAELEQGLREEGLEQLHSDEEAVEVAQKIATVLLNMAYEHIDQLNQQVQAIGNQISLNLKSEGYSDEQIIKGFLIFYTQSSELLRKAIFSGAGNVWKGAVVTVRSNGFLFKLFGEHLFNKAGFSQFKTQNTQ